MFKKILILSKLNKKKPKIECSEDGSDGEYDLKSETSPARVLVHDPIQNVKLKGYAAVENISKLFAQARDDYQVVFKLVEDKDHVTLQSFLKAHKSFIGVTDCKGRSLLHASVGPSHVQTMTMLINMGIDKNQQDKEGNTSLHEAVELDKTTSIACLLAHGSNPAVLNKKNMAPIHLAVDLNKINSLKELLNNPSVDPNVTGDYGSTPLHYAAWKERPECARLLLDHKALMCKANNVGLFPLHVAAQSSSSATMEILLDYAAKLGCGSRGQLLNKMNQEKHTPLHAAIMGGDLKVVRLCLVAGADINTKQENGNTAVHLAASQGSIEMIKLMFDLKPQEKEASLKMTNEQGHTPLHKAALADRHRMVSYLIGEGADLNAKSNDGRNALLLAASKQAWCSLDILCKAGSDTNVKDEHLRNFLHLIILGGSQPSQFSICLGEKLMSQLLNETDKYGCTPLHYASKQGLLKTIDQLLEMGAQLNAKTNKQQSALHFAASCGRINTCKQLLNSSSCCHIINETDSSGQTALHLAAEAGHDRVVSLLLRMGAGVFKDINGNTALHLAAMNGYTHTIRAIFAVHSYLIDVSNRSQNTCLHLATMEGHANVVTLLLNLGAKMLLNEEELHPLELGIRKGDKDVCVAFIAHERWKEVMNLKSNLYGCPMVGMIEYMPDVCLMVLDRSRTPSGPDKKDPDFHYLYNFEYLQLDLDLIHAYKKKGVQILPMFALNMMVKYNRVECLYHPLCVAFLNTKWLMYGLWFHLINLLIYLVFLICLTAFVVGFDFQNYAQVLKDIGYMETAYFNDSFSSSSNQSKEWFYLKHVKEKSMMNNLCLTQKIYIYVILIFAVSNMVKEFLQMIQQKSEYWKDVNNLREWVSYMLCIILVVPFFTEQWNHYQWQCGAIAIFMSWFTLLVFLQRFDVFGIYVVMFLEILKTLVQVILVFSVLIIAFGLAFYISLSTGNSPSFNSPQMSLMTSIVMMLGAIDFYQVWVDPDSKNMLPNQTLNYLMLALFILLMPILLINLLIGLAVGDIEAVLKDAKLKRIAMQVQWHTELEQKLPRRLIKYVDKPFLRVYPNPRCSVFKQVTLEYLKLNSVEMDESEEMKNSMENHSCLFREMHKQKTRSKQMAKDLKKHYELLKLIVRKMEIKTEADEFDEEGDADGFKQVIGSEPSIGWSSTALRHAILKQAFATSSWKSMVSDQDNTISSRGGAITKDEGQI